MAVNVPQYTYDMFEELYKRDFVEHFKFEEMIVFPAIVAWSRNDTYTRLIDDYTRTHKELIASGIKILKKIDTTETALPKEQLRENVVLFAELNKRNCIHAKHEDLHIVPLLEENVTLRFLTGRNMVAYQSAFRNMNLNKEQENVE